MSATPLLTPSEEMRLAMRVQNGDEGARDHMIRANLRLVAKVAYDYVNLGLPLDDLISEGNLGLMKAIDRFDPTKGAKLSTYAVWWIKQHIRRALNQQVRTIRLPVHLTDKLSLMRRIEEGLGDELGREPTTEEVANVTGVSSRKIEFLKDSSRPANSMDAPLGDDERGGYTRGDLVADERASMPDSMVSEQDALGQLSGLLKVLEERERRIIEQRFGLCGGKRKTLSEVGIEFGVTRERIRQVQNIALEKLRRALKRLDNPAVQARFRAPMNDEIGDN